MMAVVLLALAAAPALAAKCGGVTSCACGDEITANRTLDATDAVTTTQCTGSGLLIGASSITVDCAGRTIDGDDSGAVGEGGFVFNTSFSNVNITGCVVSDFFDGVFINGTSNNDIYNNTFTSNPNSGITILARTTATLTNTQIMNNTFIANGATTAQQGGIILTGHLAVTVTHRNYNITGNVFRSNNLVGIAFQIASSGNVRFSDIRIENNTFINQTSTSGGGVLWMFSTGGGLRADNSSVVNNTFFNNAIGLRMDASANANDNNNISANYILNSTTQGIFLDVRFGQNNTLTRNVFNGSGFGPLVSAVANGGSIQRGNAFSTNNTLCVDGVGNMYLRNASGIKASGFPSTWGRIHGDCGPFADVKEIIVDSSYNNVALFGGTTNGVDINFSNLEDAINNAGPFGTKVSVAPGTGPYLNHPGMQVFNTDNITVDCNLEFINGSDTTGIDFFNSWNVSVRECVMSGFFGVVATNKAAGTSPADQNGSDFLVFEYNNFTGNFTLGAIKIGDESNNITIANNTLLCSTAAATDACLEIEGASTGRTEHIRIIQNTVTATNNPVATVRLAANPVMSNITFIRNIFTGTGAVIAFAHASTTYRGAVTFDGDIINTTGVTTNDMDFVAGIGAVQMVNLSNVTIDTPQIDVGSNLWLIDFFNVTFTGPNTLLTFQNISNISNGSANFLLSRGNFFSNGSLVGINLSKDAIIRFNVSANITIPRINCQDFNITFNSTFFPNDTTRRSVSVADETSTACASPALCTEIRCSRYTLTFNVPSWSTYGAQNSTSSTASNINCTVFPRTSVPVGWVRLWNQYQRNDSHAEYANFTNWDFTLACTSDVTTLNDSCSKDNRIVVARLFQFNDSHVTVNGTGATNEVCLSTDDPISGIRFNQSNDTYGIEPPEGFTCLSGVYQFNDTHVSNCTFDGNANFGIFLRIHQSLVHCNTTLTQSTTLVNDLTQNISGTCLTIGADNIVLNCNGRTLRGNGTGTKAIVAENRTGITIANCTIRDFATGIEFTQGVNHSRILQNRLLNNTNGTVLHADASLANVIRNVTISLNFINASTSAILSANDVTTELVSINVSANNLTSNTQDSVKILTENTSISGNRFLASTGAFTTFIQATSRNVVISENLVNNTGAMEVVANENITILNNNVSSPLIGGGSGILFSLSSNGTVRNLRCEQVTNCINFQVIGETNLNFTDLFSLNGSDADIRGQSAIQANISGTINFINTTLAVTPSMQLSTVSMNLTFNNTNFTDGDASVFYTFFNLSTNPTDRLSLLIDRSNFYVNGSIADEFGVVAVNATNITDMNRSSNASMAGIDCASFRVTYNASFIRFIDALNQSFEVASHFTPQGGACTSPGTCANVRCSGSMLTFNITQFSSFGAQNQPGSIVCGGTATQSTTLTSDLSQTGSGTCIQVGADDITVDCSGFTLRGDKVNGTGINITGRKGVTIINCTIADFQIGIQLNNTNHSRMLQNIIVNMTDKGIRLGKVQRGAPIGAIRLADFNITIANNSLTNVTTGFIYAIAATQLHIAQNNFTNQSQAGGSGADNAGIGLEAGGNVSFVSNQFVSVNGPEAVTVDIDTKFVNITGNGIFGIGLGISIDSAERAIIANNQVNATSSTGMDFLDINDSRTDNNTIIALIALDLALSNITASRNITFTNGIIASATAISVTRNTGVAAIVGNISFVNMTFSRGLVSAVGPSISIQNYIINFTFNSTNFSALGQNTRSTNATLFFTFFNVSTTSADPNLKINTNTEASGENFRFSRFTTNTNTLFIGVNATNMSQALNRTANLTWLGATCNAFSLFYNASTPDLELAFPTLTINRSRVVASQNTPQGAGCKTPGTCESVRCTSGILSFNILSFSTFYVQDTQNTECNETIFYNVTLNKNINASEGVCLTIGANDITLNCAGKTLTGNGTGTTAIFVENKTGITIANCTIRNFATGIQFSRDVNHSRMLQNTFINNSNATTLLGNVTVATGIRNITIASNRFNFSTTIAINIVNQTFNINITANNFTGNGSVNLVSVTNATIEDNRLDGEGPGGVTGIQVQGISANILIRRNDIRSVLTGIGLVNGFSVENLTVIDANVTNSSECFAMDGNANATFSSVRCENSTFGYTPQPIISDHVINVTISNAFFNTTNADISPGVGGPIFFPATIGSTTFINTTITGIPTIKIDNHPLNMTFNSTNFTDGGVTLFYRYFNITTNLTSRATFFLNLSTFIANGSASERYGLIAVNATDLLDMNRSAEAFMSSIDCNKYRLFYNESFFSSISALRNSSFTVARNYTAQGSDCSAPGQCANVRCSNELLTFNITQFSSFGAQNNTPPAQPQLIFPNNGNNTLFDRNVTFVWNVSFDPDGDNITYEINVTHGFCPGFFQSGINVTNFTSTFYLCTDADDTRPFNWTVRAFDGTDFSNISETFNFTIAAIISINLTTNTTDFGSKNITNEDNTTDNVPPPFVIQNDGNVFTTISVNASQSLWLTKGLNTRFFQFKIDNTTSEPGSFNGTGSLVNFTNVTGTNLTALKQLNFTDDSDIAEVDFLIRVPSDEPAGGKSSRVTLIGVFDE